MTSPFSCTERIYSTHKYLPKRQSLPEPWIFVLRNNEYGVINHRFDRCYAFVWYFKIFITYQTVPFLRSLRWKVCKRVRNNTNNPHAVTDTEKTNTHLYVPADILNDRIVASGLYLDILPQKKQPKNPFSSKIAKIFIDMEDDIDFNLVFLWGVFINVLIGVCFKIGFGNVSHGWQDFFLSNFDLFAILNFL